MKTSVAFLICMFLSAPVMAGGDYHPNPVPPVTPPEVMPSDQVHHESRSSKAAKVLGVIGLGLISYHLIWHPKGRNDMVDGRSQIETTVEARGQ